MKKFEVSYTLPYRHDVTVGISANSAEEAIRIANDSSYGLGSSVFAGDGGDELAEQLRTGMTSVNAVAAYAAIPGLPFGGVGDSGFGRIHGPDGLREFTRAKSTVRQRFGTPLPMSLTSFARNPRTTQVAQRLTAIQHGRAR